MTPIVKNNSIKVSCKEAKKRANTASWIPINEDNVRHVWANPDGSGEITVSPDWYADNGTPVCCDPDFDGEDMLYVRTEILS